ncbi:unnamed protein product [Vitrella brassicaformis CCMP3155]|uniref:Uncharacterized protein n=2 Tax=Vitrella brassicaformis TaxID=1169539 RepID=A0A0G4E8M5_VITBC|nr:unnamed protein product [Vitrella brassicaformis CCMP3155]|eukprot:CEL91862.1 unnamed protein product [Vitrella brassicaformis CCMP3155]
MAYVLFPRMLQAEAINLTDKLLYSLLISIFDLVADILAPYSILLYLRTERFLKGWSCTRKRLLTAHDVTDTSVTVAAASEEAIAGPSAAEKDAASSPMSHQSHSLLSAALSFISTEPRGMKTSQGLQLALARLEVTPRRSLAEQVHIWSLTEMVAMLYTNVGVLGASVRRKGISPLHFLEGLATIFVLILIECTFEALVFSGWRGTICRF